MTQAPFTVFAVAAANYQPSMPRPPRESWAAVCGSIWIVITLAIFAGF
jgi:hypothetical protein